MSYSITGIQSIPQSFSFVGPEHTSGGGIHPQNTKDAVDLSSPDKFKAVSSSSASTSGVVGAQPAKAASLPEPVDTVTLSTVDKVRNLRRQGEGDTQIATTLNLPLKEVQSDLHLETQAHLSFTVAPVVSTFSPDTTATAVTVSANA